MTGRASQWSKTTNWAQTLSDSSHVSWSSFKRCFHTICCKMTFHVIAGTPPCSFVSKREHAAFVLSCAQTLWTSYCLGYLCSHYSSMLSLLSSSGTLFSLRYHNPCLGSNLGQQAGSKSLKSAPLAFSNTCQSDLSWCLRTGQCL